MKRREWIRSAMLVGSSIVAAPHMFAQAISQGRPINMLVPFSPGADTDLVARLIAEGMSRELRQHIVIENKIGAGGQIAMQSVASAPPDGTRLMLTVQGATTILPNLKIKPPYDPTRDFTPIGRVATTANALIVRTASPIKSVADLVARAKREPNKLNYGSWGIGSGGHLAGEIVKLKADLKTEHVAYKGTAEVVQALIAGEVDYAFVGYGLATAQSKAGQVHVLAVLGSQRAAAWPQTPTLQEAGYDFAQDAWFAVVGPAGLPEAVRQALEAALLRAADSPAFKERLSTLGITAAPLDGAQLRALIAADHKQWAAWIERLAIPRT